MYEKIILVTLCHINEEPISIKTQQDKHIETDGVNVYLFQTREM